MCLKNSIFFCFWVNDWVMWMFWIFLFKCEFNIDCFIWIICYDWWIFFFSFVEIKNIIGKMIKIVYVKVGLRENNIIIILINNKRFINRLIILLVNKFWRELILFMIFIRIEFFECVLKNWCDSFWICVNKCFFKLYIMCCLSWFIYLIWKIFEI